MQMIQATAVLGCSRPMETRRGTRIVATFRLPDGSEKKMWRDPGYQPLIGIKKGDVVQLAQDAKGALHFIDPPDPAAAVTGAAPSPTPAESSGIYTDREKHQMASRIEQNADLLAFCLQTARNKFVTSQLVNTEESMRALATTLFLQEMRSR